MTYAMKTCEVAVMGNTTMTTTYKPVSNPEGIELSAFAVKSNHETTKAP